MRASVVRAELDKLITLPALRWVALLTWAATAVLALAAHRAAPADDPVLTALRWTQAGFLILGVLAATQEYEPGGQIRATLLASPRRYRLAAAKAGAVVAGAVALAFPIVLASPIASASTASTLVAASLSVVAYLAGLTLIGAAAGMLLRNAPAATTTVLTTYLIVCPLARAAVPGSASWLPDTALLEPSLGAAAATLWPAITAAAAAAIFRRRDA
ncbi:hypothetical protein [Paractinoplanes abujensis]|uniref:ABC transporter permease n=1 Tax=Paractinoplanes abujensis TaxID=882441 RepID=A0A7W7CM53_9ACTN|nr:hypothetical protein [Actinoplanes abujensis]MBB4691048.1 hypothetical protein [Actinoplanes abujensis]